MNARFHKTVFSKRTGQRVAVGEHASSQGKANGSTPSCTSAAHARPLTLGTPASQLTGLLCTACLWLNGALAQPAPDALPSGGSVGAGSASISRNGPAMSIAQGSDRAIINWQSFNIGKDASVSIAQPSSQSVLLNRVSGDSPSQIFGKLSANGQVVLINPNGMTFGKDGSVSAGGFTASTLGISDANFMNGNMHFERNGATGSIVHQGKISTNGGYVALLGASVSNEGRIETRGGAALLGSAETIQIPLSGSGRVKLALSPAQINASLINAKEAVIVTEGGQVYLQAAAVNQALASITQSGSIDTSAALGGAVHLLAENGQIKVDGSIKANSTRGSAGGDIYIGRDKDTHQLAAIGDASGAVLESAGGFVETSGALLKVDGARVIAKNWLLDPYNINIASSTSGTVYSDPNSAGSYTYVPSATSRILASDIQNSLNNGTNVKISTGLTGSAGSDAGNIVVESSILKSSGGAATLTLEANNSITINSGVSITDSSMATRNLGVKLTANAASGTSSSSALFLHPNASINVGGVVDVDVTKSVGGGLNGSAIFLRLGSLNSAQNNGGSRTFIRGSGVNINMALSGANTWGLFGEHASGIEASNGDLNITATYSGATSASGAALYLGSNWNMVSPPASSYLKATNGAVNVQSITTGTSADGAMNLIGTSISATNGIKLKAQMTDATRAAIMTTREFNDPKINSSAGNVLIQSNLGAIRLNNLTEGAITGTNITIDNTGSGLIRDAIGNYAKGSGTFTGTTGASISLSGSGTGIKASGNLDLIGVGASSAVSGVMLSGTGLSAGRVYLQGENIGTGSGNTNGFYNTGTVTSTSGDVYIKGFSQKDNALSLQGAITGKTDVTIIGESGDASTVNSSFGLYLNNTVTAQTGNLNVTASSTSGSFVAANLVSGANLVTSGTGKTITVNADTLSLNTSGASINAGSSGTVNIRPASSGIGINLGGSDVTTTGSNVLGLSNAELGRVSAGQLNIGSTLSGNMTVSSAVTTADTAGNIALTTGGNLGINAALQTGTTGSKNLAVNLTGSGSATQTAGIKTKNLELLGSHANYTFNNGANDAATLAASVKSLAYTDANALTVGIAGNSTGISASGAVSVATLNGDLTVTQAVGTSDTTGLAIVMNAGQASSAGTASGGDIQLSASYSFTTGSGGRTTLYTGTTSNTNLTSLVGTGTGRFRYNSDESSTNYTAALGSGPYAIYREARSVGIALNSQTKTYDGQTYSGGNGFTATGTLNGDGTIGLSGMVYGGAAQGVRNAGTYSLTGSGLTSSLGYSISGYTPATLTISKANASVSGTTTHLSYNGQTQTQNAPGTSGFVAGDAITVSGAATGRNAGTYTSALSVSGTDAGNYNITITNADLVIGKATLLLYAVTDSKVYDGSTSSSPDVQVSGLQPADSISNLRQSFDSRNAGSRTLQVESGYAVNDGNGGNNYTVNTTTASGTIQRATLSASLQGSTEKVYDANTNAGLTSANFAITGWVSGEGASVTQTQGSYADKNVAANQGSGAVTAALQETSFSPSTGTILSNYILPSQASGNIGKITPASLTIKVNDSSAFVTQEASSASQMGYAYSGFVGTENASSALSFVPGAANRSYLGATQYPLVGQYAEVFGLNSVPTARHDNYSITVQKGKLTVVPVDQLLITIQSQSDTYGNRKASNAGQADTVTAQYCVVSGSVCSSISSLNMTRGANSNWSGTDTTGSTVQFDTTVPTNGNLSQGGYLNAGNHTFGIANLSLQSPGNYLHGAAINGGILTVDRLALNPSVSGVSKVYDSTKAMSQLGLGLQGVLPQDGVSLAGVGEYAGRNAGRGLSYFIRNLTLEGSDRNNYALAGDISSYSGNNGAITPAPLRITSTDVVKTYDGTQTALGTAVVTGNTQLFGTDTLSGGTFSFASRHAGTGDRTVSVRDVNIQDGNGGQNYDVVYEDNTRSTILKADAHVIATPATVTYNGQTQSQTAPVRIGFLADDSITISGAASGRNAGSYSSNLLVSGTDAVNYNISITNADLIIRKADATVTANSAILTYNGQTQNATGYSVHGLLGSDTVADLTNVNASGASGRNAGIYPNTVSAGLQSNYNLTLQNGSLQILPKPIRLIGTATQLSYNGLTQHQRPASLIGAIASDDVNYTGLAQGRDPGQYQSRLELTGLDAANYSAQIEDAALVISRATNAGNPMFKPDEVRQIERLTRITLSGFNGNGHVGAAVAGRKDYKQIYSAPACTSPSDDECTCQTPADSIIEVCTSDR